MSARGAWPVRVFRLGDEPGDDLSATTSAEERLAMVFTLTLEAWSLTGRPLPDYRRDETPVSRRPWPPPRSASGRLNEDFGDLLRALVEAGARFLVVGAHAMAVHGVPRATGDIDVWVAAEPQNAERVWRALLRFGAPMEALGLSRDDFTRRDQVVQIGLPPRRIDLLTSLSGVEFDEAWPGRVTHGVGSLVIPFIGREALVRNKRAAGRAKDRADLEALGEPLE